MVSLFRSADKINEDEAVVHLVLPPPPPPPMGGGGGGVGPITRSRFLPARGEGGDWYNTTTCGMAKDTKDPCISHVDASHAERPRTESSLAFL